jgi:hypothetical protein
MIYIDMTKAKSIAHEVRRAKRAEEFAPHDEVIMKQIPGVDQQAAEAARQEVRNKYAALQDQINSAETVDQLKTIISGE